MKKILMTLLLSSLLAGCTGKIVVKQQDGTKLTGIPFRLAETWEEYFTYTTVETEEGVSDLCEPELRTRVLDNVPSSQRYTIAYDPHWFEKQKLAVTLHASGTLASVSIESTPVSPKELAEVAQIVAGLPMFVPSPTPSTKQQAQKGRPLSTDQPQRDPCTGTPHSLGRCQIGDAGYENCREKRLSLIQNLTSSPTLSERVEKLEGRVNELQGQLLKLWQRLHLEPKPDP